jgi:hypothetical protein
MHVKAFWKLHPIILCPLGQFSCLPDLCEAALINVSHSLEHLVMLTAHKLHAFLTIAFNAGITWTGKIQTEKIAHPAATLDFESLCKRFAILAILVSLPHLIHVSCDVLHKVPKSRLPSEGSSPKRRDNVRVEFEDVILYIACALQLFQKWFVHL